VSFVHENASDFDALLRIAAGRERLSLALIEKDYWVTHTLWALHQRGLEVHFKGGTSLSKGFGIIERFSEDLDLKIAPGAVDGLPVVTDWRRDSTTAKRAREAFFRALTAALVVPGVTKITLNPDQPPDWRNANIFVHYPGNHLADLGVAKRWVQLEIGDARVTPFVPRDLSSFVHDGLGEHAADFEDNRPKAVRCVHPLVTLLEKLEAIRKHTRNDAKDPATFVRHFEDAARIIARESRLPPMAEYANVCALADEMVQQKQVKARPAFGDPAFAIPPGARTDAIQRAHAAIGPMYWGERIPLDEACASIRDWIARTL
jgi:hypothetical protein